MVPFEDNLRLVFDISTDKTNYNSQQVLSEKDTLSRAIEEVNEWINTIQQMSYLFHLDNSLYKLVEATTKKMGQMYL